MFCYFGMVLSIGKIVLGQHRYYEQQVARGADDYYSGRGEVPGEWAGAGARALGLQGRVSAAQFNALIAGHDPRASEERLRSAPHDPKVAALDLTWSAPKSVSVLFAIALEVVSGELAGCHEEAVRAALAYLEETAVLVRRGRAGEHVQPGEGLVAAAYRHRMSRALDPQLHTHVVAANLTRGPDGRFTALHATALYRAAKTAGYLYQAHLRVLVSERLGLEWGPVRKGAAELTAVPAGVLAEFSRRRHAMERAASEGGIGLQSKAAAESAAIATRDRKRYGLETHTWREEVRSRAAEHGLGTREVGELLHTGRERAERGGVERELVDERAVGDRLAGAGGLTERANTFDERPVLQGLAAAATQGALVDEVRAQATRFAGRPDIIATRAGEMTSADLVACERRLIAAAVGRAGERCAIVDASLLDRVLAAADRPLTDEQAAAVRATVTAGQGVSVIEALAGTGKTYTAGVLRRVYERAGYRVIGVAPTGRAARELTEEAGVPARTLDRLLIDIEQLGEEIPYGGVVILDEAGMAPTRASARLLEAAQHAGAKVVAIGDPGQLASVQAGGWLGALAHRLGAQRLTEVMRQRDPAERRALAALHEHQPTRYLQWAKQHGRIHTFPDPAGARTHALEGWQRATAAAGPAQAVMIARDNETRAALNTAARELRRAQGHLGEERTYGALSLAVGDRVICRRNDALVDVDNGMRGTVRHLDPERVVIDTDAGVLRELPAAYAAEHLEHAYALTGHGMQGATLESAIVLATPRDLTAGWSYTALSRARGHTHLLIHDENATQRSEFAPEDHLRAGYEELLARAARRMLERDDEDLAVEQLPAAGRADDHGTATRLPAGEPPQEHAAARAEPTMPPPAGAARLRELHERVEQLQAQLAALPTQALRRIEDLDARAATITTQREQLAARLAAVPAPRRRLGREHDPHTVERANLTSALHAGERELHATLTQRQRLARELGDPAEARAEREGIQRALAHITGERTQLRDELAKRELHNPGAWVRATLGERPEQPRAREVWENAVRHAARYRAEHTITDPADPLGPRPQQREQLCDWERARTAIERAGRKLGRDAGAERDTGLGIGL
jgi:conjugative relaxase-like TrwC/TraI family protein